MTEVKKVEAEKRSKDIKEAPKQRTIKDISVGDLKVMVYDKSMQLTGIQRELEILNQEIISRQNKPATE